MITVENVALSFGGRVLFKDVNAKFLPGNCYGLIGANGAGKSTFLKLLSGKLDTTEGRIHIDANKRIAVLQQDQFAFDEFTVMDTVIQGHKELHALMKERDELYSKEDMTEEEGMRVGELESEFAELGGYEAEAEASSMLDGLGIGTDLHDRFMKELEGTQKVRVLLAQAMFGNPDILLLDEPTNQLDLRSIEWLEEFLFNFENTVIVVSHDRHFLNNVCTHIADIDYGQLNVYVGNYDFWYQASQLSMQQRQNENKKKAVKLKELKEFVQRFSSNASKAKQATSRKKLIEKLEFEEFPASTRKFPYVSFKPNRPCGKIILEVEGLSKTIDGQEVLKDFDLIVRKEDKIAFIGPNGLAKTTFFQIITGKIEPDAGTFKWGTTVTPSYLPKDNDEFFETNLNLIEWLLQFAAPTEGEQFARSFLGRMLFTGEEATKKANVLSGGEKVRCMLSKMMLSEANVLLMDEPTNHLDLESITSLNEGLIKFPEVILFSSHDYEFINTVANRIIEFGDKGVIERAMKLEDYVKDEKVIELRKELYSGNSNVQL
ncbi:MAG: ABC transporter ATP-binding protein [Deltaproteobacteria bacterium]|nr:ABC transporter ATP-binding protein [Deltaproteobacteria bacterium]MBU54251.1 ABC transporter ATP-binding protein [Deltaproteobacteria bacterium]|tara:strand:- start:12182 stop:13819 length:1638 start_codon:yes stop_codon:yes gene_type:complete